MALLVVLGWVLLVLVGVLPDRLLGRNTALTAATLIVLIAGFAIATLASRDDYVQDWSVWTRRSGGFHWVWGTTIGVDLAVAMTLIVSSFRKLSPNGLRALVLSASTSTLVLLTSFLLIALAGN